MTRETDLPCSDCGGTLLERDVSARDLAAGVDASRTVVVAECTECGARHYPDGTLERLFDASDSPATARGP
jgi:predicted RNA-binding Zn-ribbon protein involved in translation (DUF1610 family)